MARHRPEQTALFQLIERYYPTFLAAIESRGGALPSFVRRAFEDCPDRRRASAARAKPRPGAIDHLARAAAGFPVW
jgi:hypothetical protein